MNDCFSIEYYQDLGTRPPLYFACRDGHPIFCIRTEDFASELRLQYEEQGYKDYDLVSPAAFWNVQARSARGLIHA